VSRSEFACRVSILAESTEQLREQLERVAAQRAAGSRPRNLPLLQLCDADALYGAEQLAAALLELAPMEVRRAQRESATQLADIVSRQQLDSNTPARGLLEDAAELLRCEQLMQRLLRHYAAISPDCCGSGIGGELAKCLNEPERVEAVFATLALAANEWCAGAALRHHGASPGGASGSEAWAIDTAGVQPQRARRYALFAQQFSVSLGGTEQERANLALRSAVEQGKYSALRTHDGGASHTHEITLSRHLTGSTSGLGSWLGALYAAGVNVRWERFYEGQEFRKVALPTYPYQRKSHWFTDLIKEP
jgi:acyl transferase domain-containing protein